MTTTGIEAVHLETHNWGKSVKFFQALGYELEFATDHNSGLLRSAQGPYLFVAEVPAGESTGMQAVLKVPTEDSVPAEAAVEVVSPFEDTHFGTREMTVRDPDGRHWILQAPPVRADRRGSAGGVMLAAAGLSVVRTRRYPVRGRAGCPR